MNTIERKEEPLSQRDQLLSQAQSLLNIPMSESMSARAVDAFFRRQFEAERLLAIVALSDKTEVSISQMIQRSAVEQNVISSLIGQDKIELAKEIALDPQKGRAENANLFEKAEKWMESQRELSGFVDFE
jgi:hypothetical protein